MGKLTNYLAGISIAGLAVGVLLYLGYTCPFPRKAHESETDKIMRRTNYPISETNRAPEQINQTIETKKQSKLEKKAVYFSLEN